MGLKRHGALIAVALVIIAIPATIAVAQTGQPESSSEPEAQITDCPALSPELPTMPDTARQPAEGTTCIDVSGLDPTRVGPPPPEVQQAICDAIAERDRAAVTPCEARTSGFSR